MKPRTFEAINLALLKLDLALCLPGNKNLIANTVGNSKEDDPFYARMDAFTDQTYRDMYPAIDPSRPELSQAEKVIVITGATRGPSQQIILYSGICAIELKRNTRYVIAFAALFPELLLLLLCSLQATLLVWTKKITKEISPSTEVGPIATY
ncbi:hypothetical protein BBP40_004837, partial [Aspergillus hancockii]